MKKINYTIIWFPFILVLLTDCNFGNKGDSKVNSEVYNIQILAKSNCSNDSLTGQFILSNDKLYFIEDSYYSSNCALFGYLFVDFKMNNGDTLVIAEPVYYNGGIGDLSWMRRGVGYVVVMLDKDNDTYFFKHRIYKTPPRLPLVEVETVMDSTLYTVNKKSPFDEAYFKVRLTKSSFEVLSFCKVNGQRPWTGLPY